MFIGILLFLAGPVGELSAFEAKNTMANGVRVDVKPVQMEPGRPVIFKVWLNTHYVDLGYDMTEISILSDDLGNQYTASSWKGSPPGGHHRRGILEFPTLEGNPKELKLILHGIAGVPEITFRWNIGS
jgi:hypothetical protein